MVRQFIAVRRGSVAITAIAAVALLAAGCGSSTTTTGTKAAAATPSSSASTSASVAAAQAIVTKAEQVPSGIGITAPLTKKPASGKQIIFLQCSTAVCGGFLSGLQPAAAALGWTVKGQPFTQTPEGIQTAVQAAITAHPSAIFYTGIDAALIKTQLAAAKAAKIPIVNANIPNTPANPVLAIIQGAASSAVGARLPADWIAANGGGNTLAVDIPTYPVLVKGTEAFTSELTKMCSTCKVTTLNQQVTDVGTNLPAAVVSALQADPSIKNVAFAFGDMSLGVYAALQAAGLTNIHLVQYGASSPSQIADVAAGRMSASLSWSIPYESWRAIDTFARYFNGQSYTTDTNATFPQMLVTKANAAAQVPHPASSFQFTGPLNYESQFKTLWGVA